MRTLLTILGAVCLGVSAAYLLHVFGLLLRGVGMTFPYLLVRVVWVVLWGTAAWFLLVMAGVL